MNQGNLKRLDYELIDYVFEMGDGYVLDFSNKTFTEFFVEELGVDIDNHRYCDVGTSKAKRLRSFLKQSVKQDVLKVLNGLWEYREIKRKRAGNSENKPEFITEYFQLIERIGGKSPHVQPQKAQKKSDEKLEDSIAINLLNKLMEVSQLDPNPRGYAFKSY